MSPPAFESVEELAKLVQSYEAGTLSPIRWTHEAQLAVALWYLKHLPEQRATDAYIASLLRYNRTHHIEVNEPGGYHETLTLFWLAVAQQYLCAAGEGKTHLELTNDFVAKYGDRTTLFLEYYSPDLIWSWRARQTWVEPDLKPFDGCNERQPA